MTVAIPVRDGLPWLEGVLAALARQTREHELLICDSGSEDGSVELARRHAARVVEISPGDFGHGRTRNLLMSEASGRHVAFLTQDAEPADPQWLGSLLGGFELAPDVGLVYGPYVARPGAAFAVRSELERWFESLSAGGVPIVERLQADEREHARRLLLGRRGFFADANACIAREAWERVPFRDVAYAEDRALALDMMLAGYAKCYVPGAAVLHSHDYSPIEQLRRSFDESRGLHEVFGWREPADPRRLVGQLRGEIGQARRELRAERAEARTRAATLAAVSCHHLMRLLGAALGSRAEALPASLRRRLSLEQRDGGGDA